MTIRITGGGGATPRYWGDLASEPTAWTYSGSAYANTTVMRLYQWTGTTWKAIYNLSLVIDRLLLETGDKILLENGTDAILLE